MPPELAEAMARVDGAESKQLTKDLHSHTKQLGEARKQLATLKAARAKHTHAWAQYLEQTVQSLNHGSEQFQKQTAMFDDQETAAKTRMSNARDAIRQLTTDTHAPSDVDTVEADSDVELVQDRVGTLPNDADTVQQAQKRVRTALTSLIAKLPEPDPVTPKRRGRDSEASDGPN